MEEIKDGDYVRTIYGEITRLKEGHTASGLYYYPESKIFDGQERCNHISNRIIKKHSKNIIDLIEVGDYVNGAKVADIDIDDDEEGTGKKYLWCEEQAIIEEDIETIVTCEQFTNMEYKVEEN